MLVFGIRIKKILAVPINSKSLSKHNVFCDKKNWFDLKLQRGRQGTTYKYKFVLQTQFIWLQISTKNHLVSISSKGITRIIAKFEKLVNITFYDICFDVSFCIVALSKLHASDSYHTRRRHIRLVVWSQRN